MDSPLLTTKLYVPPLRSELVPRPGLMERLNAGLHHKLILISAPAGFGKTTLLSEWIHGRQAEAVLPLAWISIDEGDNDPTHFWVYFIAALETLHAGVGETATALLHTSPPSPIEIVLTTLINAIAAAPNDLAVVLDDYHLIEAQEIHTGLTFLLEHLPPQLHLIIASRADPPLPLARLRARDQLTELRASDLRFTTAETATFLNQVMGLNLTATHIAALETRTEGWIAGLQLAALSLQGRQNVPDFITAFAGSQHYILDYLVEEVLQRQTERVQTFLLKTSILNRLTGPLCDVLTQTGPSESSEADSSQAMLHYLEHANLFIIPLDDRQHWYRYHRLFADFLRVRLQRLWPDLVSDLHRRASEWYEQTAQSLDQVAGEDWLLAEAITHALAIPDFGRAANLIEQVAEATMLRSEIVTWQNWVEALPDEVVRSRPLLCFYHTMTLLLNGQPLELVEARLHEIMAADTGGVISGELTVFRALLASYRGDIRQSAALSQQALELLPRDSLFLRSLVAGIVGLNYLYGGNIEAATNALEEAARISQQVGNVMNSVLAICHLAELAFIQGRLHQAQSIYQQALELAIDRQGQPQPIGGLAMIGLGHLWREWNDLEGAARALTAGLELIKQWGQVGAIQGYAGLARVRQAQGDVAGANEMIEIARQLALKFDAMDIDDMLVGVHQTQLWLAQDNLAAAVDWVQARGLDRIVSSGQLTKVNELSFVEMIEYVTLAQVYIAQAQPEAALKVAKPLLQIAELSGWNYFVIYLLVIKALAWQLQGNEVQTMIALARALSLAEPEGYVRVFVEQGPPMVELLRQAASRAIAVDYVSKLLAAFPADVQGSTGAAQASASLHPSIPIPDLLEPLSEREFEVLHLIAAGLSNREIADELVVAVSTVKTHLNNIYRKLDVSSRTQAVARARDLQLL